MTLKTLDSIVRSCILQAGYSLHWYLQFMKYAADGYRELHFDSLKCINAKRLTLNGQKAVDLPNDYVDAVKIGIINGQDIRQLVQRTSINRLINRTADFAPTTYGSLVQEGTPDYTFIPGLFWLTNLLNENNEFLGRMFGLRQGALCEGYKILPERNQIQFDEQVQSNEIVLEYISNGQSVDSASRVDPYAQAAIEAYIFWKLKVFGRHYNNQDRELAKREFDMQHARLRARKNPLTVQDVVRILNNETAASIKI